MAGDGSSVRENTIVLKSATEDLASDATVNNDTILRYLCSSGEKYLMSCYLRYTAGAGGIRATFNGPAISEIGYGLHIIPTTGSTVVAGNTVAWGTEVFLAGASGGTVLMLLYFKPSASGTVYVQWAQQASNVENTSVVRGAYLDVKRIS